MCHKCESPFIEDGFVNAEKASQHLKGYPTAKGFSVSIFDQINVKNEFGEGFWASVVSVEDGKIFATVNNDLEITTDYSYGDKIVVKPCHVRAIEGKTNYTFKNGQLVSGHFN